MREISKMELATVSGGAIADWINSLFKPAAPRKPWVNPFPSDNTQTGAVETLGKVVFATGVGPRRPRRRGSPDRPIGKRSVRRLAIRTTCVPIASIASARYSTPRPASANGIVNGSRFWMDCDSRNGSSKLILSLPTRLRARWEF